MLISIIIPARNEARIIRHLLEVIAANMQQASLLFECVVVDDGSTDDTPVLLSTLQRDWSWLRVVHRCPPCGLGYAIRDGLAAAHGAGVIITMGDGSDAPSDLVRYAQLLEQGYDAIFGSRFLEGASIDGYSRAKLFVNRVGNQVLRVMFGLPCCDLTNAFKAYRMQPLRAAGSFTSTQFEITVELSLKVLCHSRRVAELPISWSERTSGRSHFKIVRQCLRYLLSAVWLRMTLPPLPQLDWTRIPHSFLRHQTDSLLVDSATNSAPSSSRQP